MTTPEERLEAFKQETEAKIAAFREKHKNTPPDPFSKKARQGRNCPFCGDHRPAGSYEPHNCN